MIGNREQSLASAQQTTEDLSSTACEELNPANNHAYLEVEPFPSSLEMTTAQPTPGCSL